MKFKQLPIVAVASVLAAAPMLVIASDHEEPELDEAQLYFELNDTDGDLGIHGKADGDAWKRMVIEGPEGDMERTLLRINTSSGLRRQGLTELFFESSEPTFGELNPEVFFNRFLEGVYEWEGLTLDNQVIEGEIYLSQVIPAAPVVASVGGRDENPGFDEEGDKICWEVNNTNRGVTIEWEAVTESHFDKWSNGAVLGEEKLPLGNGGDIEVLYYEFVAEIDGTEYKSTALIPPGVNEWTIPEEFIDLVDDFDLVDEDEEPIDEIKFEIIVRVETGEADNDGEIVKSRPGNQSAVEDCFEI